MVDLVQQAYNTADCGGLVEDIVAKYERKLYAEHQRGWDEGRAALRAEMEAKVEEDLRLAD